MPGVAFLLLILSQAPDPDTLAAEPPAGPPWHDEIVVTATRSPRPASEVPASVAVVARPELDLSPALTLDDTLRRVPGLSLFRRSSSLTAHPTTQGVSLRGLGASAASRTLVLLDGVALNDPFGGWVYWSRLPHESLERVEVARGGGSDVWGDAALGGVVQLLTRPVERSFLTVSARAGSRGTALAGLAAGRSGRRSSGAVDVRGFSVDGYPAVRSDQRGAIDIDAFSRHGTFYGKLDHQTSPSASLAFRANLFREERGNGTPLTNNDTGGGFLSGGATAVTGRGTWRAQAAVYRQRFGSTFSAQATDRDSERPALDQFDVRADAARGEVRWSRSAGERHHLASGVELAGVRASTAEDFFFVGDLEAGAFTRRRRAGGRHILAGVYLQDEIVLGERFRLTVSGRFDRWQSRSGFRREEIIASGDSLRREDFRNRRRTSFSPRLGLRYLAGGGFSFYGAAYRAFRAPTVNELFRPFRVRGDITEANAELEPERLGGVELGLSHEGRRSRVRLTAFTGDTDDAVANVTLAAGPGRIDPCGFVPAGGSCRQRRNLETVRVRGVEADAQLRPATDWRLTASVLWSDPEIRDAPAASGLVGRRLAQVPEWQWVASLAHTDTSRLGAYLQVRYVGSQFEDDGNTRRLASFVVVDLALRRQLRRGFEVFLGAENLLGRTVEAGVTADGLVTVGAPRLVHAGMRWRR